MTPERVAQIENLPDAVRKVMLAMRGHLDCRPQFQLLFNAIDDLLAERRQIEEATTKRRRELSGIIRDWQKFAARLGEMLDCVAITDGIEKAVKKVLAERREREKDSRLTERIRNLLPFVDDASLDRFENEIKAGEHIAELEASLREREKQQAKLENDLANAAAVAMTYGPDALDNIGPNDGKLTTVSGEGERIAQLEAQKVELEQRRNETVAMCTQLQAELAQVKAELPCGVVRTSQGDFFCYYHKEHSGQHLFELVNSLRAELAQAQEENCELTGATEQASGVIEGLHAELATEREDRKAVLAAIEVARKAEGETIERLTAELAAAQQIVTATIDVLDKYCRGDATKATTPGNLAEIVEKILKSDRRAEIEAEEALSAARRLGDEALRQALFDGHGCPLKYGDDGELQCARLPMIDFKRDSITDIRLKSMIHGQKRMDEARLPEPLPSQVTSESEQK